MDVSPGQTVRHTTTLCRLSSHVSCNKAVKQPSVFVDPSSRLVPDGCESVWLHISDWLDLAHSITVALGFLLNPLLPLLPGEVSTRSVSVGDASESNKGNDVCYEAAVYRRERADVLQRADNAPAAPHPGCCASL